MGTGCSQIQASQQPTKAVKKVTTAGKKATEEEPTASASLYKPMAVDETVVDPATRPANYNHESLEVKESLRRREPQVVKQEQQQLPHNYEAIVKDADSPINKSGEDLLQQLRAGIFLNQKRQKYWVDKNLNNCFMIYARSLDITWGDTDRYWIWLSQHETSDVSIDVAELLDVCLLNVNGKFDTAKLSPGTLYEAVFVVKMKSSGYGWELPVNVRLIFPDKKEQWRKVNFIEAPKDKWIEIPVGEFRSAPEKLGEIGISLFETEGGEWKRGLVIKEILIQPTNA